MTALQWLQEEHDFHNILDMGCGGGILSVLCAHLWDCNVMAADISEKAVADTKAAVSAENLDGITTVRSDGFGHPQIRENAPYDLMLINLLAEPIASWAGDIRQNLAAGGCVYLGGILQWKSDGIRQLYSSLGFEIIKEFTTSPWVGYVIRYNPVTI